MLGYNCFHCDKHIGRVGTGGRGYCKDCKKLLDEKQAEEQMRLSEAKKKRWADLPDLFPKEKLT